MAYTVNEIKDSIAYCGLVCKLCNESIAGKCNGCKTKCTDCTIKSCAESKGINGCWECKEYPCNQKMFTSIRVKAFHKCAQQEGVEKLAEYLKNNYDQGILYHKADGSKGDYDLLSTEEQILDLLRRK